MYLFIYNNTNIFIIKGKYTNTLKVTQGDLAYLMKKQNTPTCVKKLTYNKSIIREIEKVKENWI